MSVPSAAGRRAARAGKHRAARAGKHHAARAGKRHAARAGQRFAARAARATLTAAVALGGALAVVLVAAALDFRNDFLRKPLAATETRLEVAPGDTVQQLLDQARAAGLDIRRDYFRLYARLTGADRRLRPGEYLAPAGETAPELLARITAGRAELHRFTIVAGWTFARVLDALRKHPAVRMDGVTEDALRRRFGGALEGRFLPETYLFHKGIDGADLLAQSRALMHEKMAELWPARAAGLPLKTTQEALALASIVEKEGRPDEFARIAGVFVARLQRGMRLQADPAVIYGLGDAFDGDLRKRDLERDTPYNTYRRAGLPPTPIAMPSLAALRATLAPRADGALYFVGKNDGSHYFSKTYEEHLEAVKRYQLRR